MPSKPLLSLLAAIAVLCAAGEARAQYFNDDFITLPNGPIELEHAVETPTVNGYILSGDAVNLSSQTYTDVKYLDEWVFDSTPQSVGPPLATAFSYDDLITMSNLWTSIDGNSLSIVSPDGFIMASDVTPLPTTDTPQKFTAPPGSVAPTDLLPYTDVGTIGPFASVPFAFAVNLSGNFNFALDSSFVSTTEPVIITPEPSTFALLLLGAVALLVVVGYRRRTAAV